MLIIGIDIGLMGSIACIDEDGKFIYSSNTPINKRYKLVGRKGKEIKKRVSEYDIQKINEIMLNLVDKYPTHKFKCFIEEALIIVGGGKKRFNAKTNVSLARCQGIFEGIATSYRMNPEIVDPRVWQKHFGISGKNGDTGDQSVTIAKSLFPEIKFYTNRGRRLDGLSDAILLAYYGMSMIKTRSISIDQ